METMTEDLKYNCTMKLSEDNTHTCAEGEENAIQVTNYLELCLLCTSAPNTKHPHVNIRSDLGKNKKLLEKIEKHLTITVEDWLPEVICWQCISKLNICHELVKCSEKAHAQFVQMRDQLVMTIKTEPVDSIEDECNDIFTNGHQNSHNFVSSLTLCNEDIIKIEETCLTEITDNDENCNLSSVETPPNPPMSSDMVICNAVSLSKIDFDTPVSDTSIEVDCVVNKIEEIDMSTSVEEETDSIIEEQVENLEIEVDPWLINRNYPDLKTVQVNPILQNSSHVILGSQLAFFYVESTKKCIHPSLHIVVINMDYLTARDKSQMLEKISRISKQCKPRLAYLQKRFHSSGNQTVTPLIVCDICHFSFFTQEEMVCHFESLHPSEKWALCYHCGQKLLWRFSEAVEEHIKFHIISCHSHPFTYRYRYDPEFVVLSLGLVEHNHEREALKLMYVLNTSVINPYIKTDMRNKIWIALKSFILCVRPQHHAFIRRKRGKRDNLNVQCEYCKMYMSKYSIKRHIMTHLTSIESYLTNRINNCCHCSETLRQSEVELHVENRHFGGTTLLCVICDAQYNQSGKEQPHMMRQSCQKYKCPYEFCKRGYMYKKLLQTHIDSIHAPPSERRILRNLVQCHFCNKTFRNKGILSLHIRMHLRNTYGKRNYNLIAT